MASLQVPSINDPNSGYKLVSTAVSEENLAEISSLYSEPNYDNDIEVSGSVRFAVWYRNDEKILYVRIVNASDLAVAKGKTLNPYVKVYLLPDKSKHTKRMTGIERNTSDPEFDEVVKYKVTREELNTSTLWLSVWDWDFMGRNKFLGEVLLPIFKKNFDLSSSRTIKYSLQEHDEDLETDDCDTSPPGKLCISLKYEFLSSSKERFKRSTSLTPDKHASNPNLSTMHSISPHESMKSLGQVSPKNKLKTPDKGYARERGSSLPHLAVSGVAQSDKSSNIRTSNILTSKTAGRLFIRIMHAEDLLPVDSTGATNPFVRIYLLPTKGIKGKKKTSIVPKCLNPVWDEECSYNMIMIDDLATRQALEISVWDCDRRGSNSFIGGLRLGPAPPEDGKPPEWMDSIGEEVSHWEEMLANSGTWVERTHELRPSMTSRHRKKASPKPRARERASESQDEISTEEAAADEVDEDAPSTITAVTVSRRIKGEHYQISGEIVLDLIYKDRILTVKVFRALGLAAVGKSLSDPFVKLLLLPDMSSKKKTKTRKKTVDPSYNQTFTYIIPKEDLATRTLWVTVWSHGGMFQQNEFLGEICVPLRSYLFESTLREMAYTLCDYDHGEGHTGDTAVYQICNGVTKRDAVVHLDDPSNVAALEGEGSTEDPAPTAQPAAVDTEPDADLPLPTLIDTPAISSDQQTTNGDAAEDKNIPTEEVIPAPDRKTKPPDGKKRQDSSKGASKKRHQKVVTTISASTRPSKAHKKPMVQKQIIET